MGEGQAHPEVVICIPGDWQNQQELLGSIVRKSEGYVFAGRTLREMKTGHAFELQFEGPDPRMLEAFRSAGWHWRDTDEMARIAGHSSVVYIIGHGGSRDNAEALIAAAAGVIKAGGLGVKIETSGLAHAPAVWLELAKQPIFANSVFRAFVVCVTGDEVYSCGMHNLGLREAIVDAADADDPLHLVNTFAHYMVSESPVIKDGQTFRVAEGAPRYRIREDEGVRYDSKQSLYTNPYGAWRLVPC
jgi:hypothetical protein